MSAPVLLELDGRTYAAGLVWLLPGAGVRRRRWTLHHAREVAASWYAERAHQTGFWTGPEPDVHAGPVRSLAHEVAMSIATEGQGTWQALLDCTGERYAIVRGRGDEILATGDLVVEGREAALDAFASEGDWAAVYASAGLVEGARLLKLAAVDTPCVLAAVPFARAAVRRRLAVAAALVIVLGALGAGGLYAWRWYQDWSRVEVAEAPAPVEEIIRAGVDVARFLERCEAARRAAPAMAPMWERASLQCHADATQIDEVSAWVDEGVWFARWRMRSGGNAAVARRLAMARLARWDTGVALRATAWGGIGFEVPMKHWDGEQPSPVAFRRDIDRSVGTLGDVTYQSNPQGLVAVLRTRYPLDTLAERLGAVAWLSLHAVARENDVWRLELVRVEPRVVMREAGAGAAS